MMILLLFNINVNAQVGINQKAQLTAAFIYQITKFTLWPESLFISNNPKFTICVLAQANENLDRAFSELESKSTKGYQIEVIRLNNKEQLFELSENNCKVLYSSDEQWAGMTEQQIARLTETTLLIGTSKRFLQLGGMVSLIIVDNKMKIFISTANIDKTPIKIESRLKALAKSI
ncbi:YfiR family protein [Aliiglaciecola litoralis]|uniref:YfiR family protein n=1 Tax=Aliiglaciecola litoralis TaxID=582857 RepID=A0ABN1LLB2_9ALTE